MPVPCSPPVVGDQSLQAAIFLGDATGSGDYSGLDASMIARVTVGLDTGFDEFPHLDPRVIGDVSGNGRLSALDASYIARKAVGLPQDEIPNILAPPPDSSLVPLFSAPAPEQTVNTPLDIVRFFTDFSDGKDNFDELAKPNSPPAEDGKLVDAALAAWPSMAIIDGNDAHSQSSLWMGEVARVCKALSEAELTMHDDESAEPRIP